MLKIYSLDKELQCIGSILLGWACYGRPIIRDLALKNDARLIISEAKHNFTQETAVLSSMGWLESKLNNPGVRKNIDDANDPLSPLNSPGGRRAKTKVSILYISTLFIISLFYS